MEKGWETSIPRSGTVQTATGLNDHDMGTTTETAIVDLCPLAGGRPIRLASIRKQDLAPEQFGASQQQQRYCGKPKNGDARHLVRE